MPKPIDQVELLIAGKAHADCGRVMTPTKSLVQRLAEISRNSTLAQRLTNIHEDSALSRLVCCHMNAITASKRFEAAVEKAMVLNSEISFFKEK